MLIIEIILTIVAWGRGWKWLAILPLGLAFGVGLIAGASGATMNDLESLIWVDILAIIALVVMSIVKKPGTQTETPKDSETK